MRVLAATLMTLSAGALIAENRGHEKTIRVPRSGSARLAWTENGSGVESVRIRNYPSAEDIQKARREDPDDHSWLWWEFEVENRGREKIHLWVEILDAKGRVVKDSDRSDTVDPGKTEDQIRLSTRLKTLEIADAPKVRIRAEIRPR